MAGRARESTATAFDHDSTLVLAWIEWQGLGSWSGGAWCDARRVIGARDMAGLLQQIERWKAEAGRAGRTVRRIVLTYEAGRDGFWIARMRAHDIEVQIMHPAVPVERRGGRKTDRIDLDMLLRTLLALRGEPRVCSMVRIRAKPRRTCAAGAGTRAAGERADRLENRIENLLCLQGITGFKPRLKKAAEQLDELRSFAGAPLPHGCWKS